MTDEETRMMSENAKRSDFKDGVLPHLESLLQFSIWLTKDGRAAVELVRLAMAEAYGSWDESIREEGFGVQLRRIVTRRFLQSNQQAARGLVWNSDHDVSESPGHEDCPGFAATAEARQQSWLTGESEYDVNYLAAFAGLPAAFRSVMILSYLEGFSNGEIAKLAGVQPQTVEISLDRGRGFLREELFTYLMDDDNLDLVEDREAATG
jgi:RNA polymerase sigma-70 factor (ECF subfamily)